MLLDKPNLLSQACCRATPIRSPGQEINEWALLTALSFGPMEKSLARVRRKCTFRCRNPYEENIGHQIWRNKANRETQGILVVLLYLCDKFICSTGE